MRLAKASGATNTSISLDVMTLEELTTLEKLNSAFEECSKISYWKESTQRYRSNLLLNNIELQEELRAHTYRISPTVDFTINEIGK